MIRTRRGPLAALVALMVALAACGTAGEVEEPETEPDTEETADEPAEDVDDDADAEPAALSGEITFTTLQLSPDFDDYIEGVIASFESEHPDATVNWVDVPFEGAQERLLADASAGTLADVINLNPDLSFPLAVEGQFIDLDEAAAEVRGDYVEGAWDSFRYPGIDGAFGYPWYLSTEVTMYNAALLEEAGLDPDDAPETFEELFETARTVAANTDARGMHPALENRFVIDLKLLWMSSGDVGHVRLGQPGVDAGLEFGVAALATLDACEPLEGDAEALGHDAHRQADCRA